MRDLSALTVGDFAALQGQRFRVSSGEGDPFDVELVEVSELPGGSGGRAPFSLVFQGGPDPTLPQRIYRLEHDGLGAIEIFLVPIAADRYEAVFT